MTYIGVIIRALTSRSLVLATEPESDDDGIVPAVKSTGSRLNAGERSSPGVPLGAQIVAPFPDPVILNSIVPAATSAGPGGSHTAFNLTPIPVDEQGSPSHERLRSLLCGPNYANGVSWEQLPLLSKFRPTLAHQIRLRNSAEFKDEDDRRAGQDFCRRIRTNTTKDPDALASTARHAASTESLYLLSRISATCVRITRAAVTLRLEEQRAEVEHLEVLSRAVAAMADIEMKARLEIGIEEGTFDEYLWPQYYSQPM